MQRGGKRGGGRKRKYSLDGVGRGEKYGTSEITRGKARCVVREDIKRCGTEGGESGTRGILFSPWYAHRIAREREGGARQEIAQLSHPSLLPFFSSGRSFLDGEEKKKQNGKWFPKKIVSQHLELKKAFSSTMWLSEKEYNIASLKLFYCSIFYCRPRNAWSQKILPVPLSSFSSSLALWRRRKKKRIKEEERKSFFRHSNRWWYFLGKEASSKCLPFPRRRMFIYFHCRIFPHWHTDTASMYLPYLSHASQSACFHEYFFVCRFLPPTSPAFPHTYSPELIILMRSPKLPHSLQFPAPLLL